MEALHIVLREHRGCLESFETDEIGRLMAADRICRVVAVAFDAERAASKGLRNRLAQDMPDRGCEGRDTAAGAIFERAITKLRKIAPDYIFQYEDTSRLDVIWQYRLSIQRRKRACRWERYRRADALCQALGEEIGKRYPGNDGPSPHGLQDRDYLETPSGGIHLSPLRLPLISKLQRLVPELSEDPLHSASAAESGWILARFMDRLDGGRQANSYDDEAADHVREIRRNTDRHNLSNLDESDSV